MNNTILEERCRNLVEYLAKKGIMVEFCPDCISVVEVRKDMEDDEPLVCPVCGKEFWT